VHVKSSDKKLFDSLSASLSVTAGNVIFGGRAAIMDVAKIAVIKRRSDTLPQVKILKIDLCNLSEMGVAPNPVSPLARNNAVVCGW
jgi:hypothetical protein